MIKAIIIEDEIPGIARMRNLIATCPREIDVIAEACTGEDAINLIDKLKPELIFLDIQLLDMTGFEVLEEISHEPNIIFTTAYAEYALDAFNHFSIDYLLKPISQDRFNQAMEKLAAFNNVDRSHNFQEIQKFIEQRSKKSNNTFSIHLRDKIILTEYEDISYFEADDKYVNIILSNGKKYLLSTTVNELEAELPSAFLRIHRSTIVNKDRVIELQKYFKGRYILTLNDHFQSKVKSSSSYTKNIRTAFDFK